MEGGESGVGFTGLPRARHDDGADFQPPEGAPTGTALDTLGSLLPLLAGVDDESSEECRASDPMFPPAEPGADVNLPEEAYMEADEGDIPGAEYAVLEEPANVPLPPSPTSSSPATGTSRPHLVPICFACAARDAASNAA